MIALSEVAEKSRVAGVWCCSQGIKVSHQAVVTYKETVACASSENLPDFERLACWFMQHHTAAGF